MSATSNIEAVFPLTPLQQGMLFHSLSAPGSAVYVIQIRGELRGPVQVRALYQAWQRIVDRHQALRAAFVWEGVDQPLQVIGKRVGLPFRHCDCRGVPAAVQQRRLDAWARQDRASGFLLSRAPLMRILLAQLDDDRYEIVWTFHHVVCDGWSRPIVIGEFWRCYDAFASGTAVQLPAPRPFAQYVAKLAHNAAASERFWRDRLGDVAHPTPLGVDQPMARRADAADQVQPDLGQRDLTLTEAETARLERWSRGHAVSLGTIVAAAWALVLSRYSRFNDVLFGVTVSGRSAALDGIESLVGLCTNTLPLRVRIRSSGPIVAWLRAVQNQFAELREHEQTPLAQIHKWSGIPSGQPLFESIVVFENFPVDAAIAPAAAATGEAVTIANIRGFDKNNFPLTLIASPAREFSLSATYDPARFTDATIDALLQHVANVLRGLMTAADRATLADVSLVSAVERAQIVASGSGTDASARRDAVMLLPQLERQAAERPDAISVVCEGRALSYATLHRRANQLAHVLRNEGVAPDVPVAVCVRRTEDLIVALLAVWKAGGAYVPLDPQVPAARLAYIVRDVGAPVLITETGLGDAIPTGNERRVYLDAVTNAPDTPPIAGVQGEHLAYVIYTSGSTGLPKGVGVTHRNIASLLAATEPLFAFGPDDTWTLFHSAGFDFSVWEMWAPLAYGGRLVIVSADLARQPDAFATLLRDEHVTVLNQTPSAFRALQGTNVHAPALRFVIFGGEALAFESLRPWVARHGVDRPTLVNMYGITETTVHVTQHAVQADDVASTSASRGSRIGQPLPQWQLYLLDRALQPVPVGVPGEIYVGGAGVARGYLGRPELTATRFVPDPFGSTPGARLYRAGDLGRWRADGTCEFIGRGDQQVKLHGYRIEPAEIEAALRDQPSVRDAVVILRDAGSPDARLVAYAVPDPDAAQPLVTDQLQQALGRVLPAYMVPSIVVPIDALPLTPNGKIDRAALPAPAGARPTLGSDYVAPRTPLEATLAEVWADVLRVDRVGIHDNFFALGGDSMRTIQVQAKAREREVIVTLEQLMRDQTIAEIAARLESESAESAFATKPFDLVSTEDRAGLPADIEDAYPLTELQAGMLFHSELDPQSALYHDVLSYHLRAAADEAAMTAALGDVMTAHPILRTSLHLTGYSEPLQLVHRTCEVPLRIEDWRHLTAADQDRTLAEWVDAQRRTRFEWTHAPLFRVQVHRRSNDTIQCTLICHHAILDGWSVAAFFTELFTAYHTRARGTAPAMTPPITTFRDYVALERASRQSAADRDYWIGHLSESSPTIIPRWADRAQPAEGNAVASATARLAPDVAAGLNRAAARAGVPLKTVLLAGHLRVLAFVANARDVVTGVVTHGRPGTADADRVLGLFLNTPPLRAQVDGSWIDLLQRVFAIERDHARHRHFPMPTLQREIGSQALFDAAFNFMHFHVYQTLVGIADLDVIDATARAETNFPFLTQCTLHGASGEIDVQLDAHRAEFSDDHLRQLLAYHERAYAALAADPDQPCTATLLTAAERKQVIVGVNQTDISHQLDRTVQDLIAMQAEATPDAIAIVDGDDGNRHSTYAELWRRVRDLARVLQRLGAAPDICVGVCLPRSANAAVAILATLQAGSAYVPLDQAYPDERLALMAEDASLRILLTTQALAPRFAGINTTIICLDDPSATLDDDEPSRAASPAARVNASHLAYVMYTSGSTGRPKGIGLPHRCLTNLIEWHLRTLGRGARTLQFASLAFDASFHEMMATWCAGGTLYFVPDDIRADAQSLARALHDQAIEKAVLPPVVLQQLAEHCGHQPALFGRLRQIITTGEQLRLTKPVVDLLTVLPSSELHNHYGPAETHVVTAAVLAGPPGSWPTLPTIGTPIDNTQIYILDRRLAPVPIGTPGELYIGGVSLARGYYNRPDLTAEKFVPDPFGATAGERLYRTGDLARWLPDGTLDFLGRIATRQVKLRGFRVELGEVEAIIGRHPGVRNVIVLVREYGADDRRLVAYFIPSGAEPPTTSDLRAFVGRMLPAFMIPAAFVALPAFPLTPNGKIDRRQLPDPQTHSRDLTKTFVAPRTPAEELVANVYRDVLAVDRVGVDDDFFERGGHSLLATQAIVRIREAFGIDVPLRTLFERPTPATMALAVAEMLGGAPIADEIAATVLEVERLSDSEVRARLADETTAPA